MWRFYALVSVIWAALLPPVFTDGQCTSEFDQAASLVTQNRKAVSKPESARDFFRSRGIPVSLVSAEQCRETKPRFLDRCSSGPLVFAKVPVQSKICSIYRDEDTKVLLQYDEKGNLIRFNTDMAPYKSLPIPFTSFVVHWAR